MHAALSALSRDLASPDATRALARRVAAELRQGDAILLEGPLGAGKTEFARALLRAATGDPGLEVPSPSYTLVQSYAAPLGILHHFDLWRLDDPHELAELGWDEAREGIVIVEWAERLGPARPAEALTLILQPLGGDLRRVTLSGWPDRIGRLA